MKTCPLANEPRKAGGIADEIEDAIGAQLDALIAEAPDAPESSDAIEPRIDGFELSSKRTGIPMRYARSWERPTDFEWQDRLERARARIEANGILGMIGNRGTGKTRLAIEIARDTARDRTIYLTAMSLFVRLQDSYRKASKESQGDIISELASARLLIIDEVQERGASAWEDRVLTHLIDKRYGAIRPTIMIANLKRAAMAESLGESICDRMNEGGGIMELIGTSHRGVK